MAKILEVNTVDPQTDRASKGVFDAGIIVAVQEFTRMGTTRACFTTGGGGIFLVDESYESLKKRWLAARDDQELVPIEPQKKLSVV